MPKHKSPQGFSHYDPEAAGQFPLRGLSALEPLMSICGTMSSRKLVKGKAQCCWAVLQGKYSVLKMVAYNYIYLYMHACIYFSVLSIYSLLMNFLSFSYCPYFILSLSLPSGPLDCDKSIWLPKWILLAIRDKTLVLGHSSHDSVFIEHFLPECTVSYSAWQVEAAQ